MNGTRSAITVIVMVLALVVAASIATAGTMLIPVSGEEHLTIVDPGVQWTDDDGITHMRGLTYESVLSGHDADGVPIAGTGTYVLNVNVDLSTGDGEVQATGISEQQYGDLSGGWRANFTATITGFVYDGMANCPRGSGDFTGWHFRATWPGLFGAGVTYYDGEIQIPGGEKAITTESESWSSVRALYR
jgi:hypothetical protein